ncbi:hypothetical protein SAMN02745206_00790 [Desulfacinum infernum DSM 9756]|uniref:RsbT co-antagonist protein rsbRD N-terminal domain-containing protein n=1 Tax=Desulfacinum infernum DSM 9756 TaxID=1121391 RepID=A0A1M4W6W4_9BACT|nr:hypothetical protein [Desulfacinum infernum]SHE76890.1 hypothetical protein SAMN02745206_00790 [Desulfacinum infernum DSM 9756]
MSDFDRYLETLKDELTRMVREHWADWGEEALKSGDRFLRDVEGDLRRWTALLVERRLTEEEFRFLVESKKDLLELAALKEAGLSAIRLEQFRNGVVNLAVSTAVDVLL